MKNIILFIYFLFYFCAFLPAQEIKYGLEFRSYEVEKEKRTGLDLTPEKPFSFSGGFSLSFDILFKVKSYQNGIKTRLVNPIFGNILRIEGNNNQNIDLVLKPESETSPFINSSPNIIFTCSGSESLVNYKFSDYGSAYNEWIHIVITVDADKNQLAISVGNKRNVFEIKNLQAFKDVRIVFGKNNFLKSLINDVPSMVVRNVGISNLEQKPLYQWSLSQHTFKGAYDELKHHFAVCSNPVWLLDKHANWEKLSTLDIKKNPQVCYNENENCVAVADEIHFFTYNTTSKTLQKDTLTSGKPCGDFINQLIYNPIINNYCSYSFEKKASFYDPVKKRWDNNKPDSLLNYWHHNRYIYPGDSCLYTFFGYGHHKYRNEILQYNFKTDSLKKIDFSGDRISPRDLSGLGKMNDHQVIAFGGYGSVTGNQELAPQYYYDAFLIDLKSRKIKKLWELGNIDQNFVVANSLVVDTIHRCFYALCFPQHELNNYFLLYQFSLDKPEYKILSDSIPFTFQDTYPYADLFLNKQDNQMIAVISSPLATDSTSTLSVYTLAFPPLAKSGLHQKEPELKGKIWVGLTGMIVLLALTGGYFVYTRIKKKRRKELKQNKESSNPVAEPEYEYEQMGGIKPVRVRTGKQSIFLFGGFQVMDKEGRDITGEFSPLLKQLFLIILFHTLKDGKGISSLKLRETLWFDKSDENAKNNRGVSLSKLRQIFEQIGIIHIQNRNSYWIVEFGEDIYCDYYEALILMSRLKDKNNRTDRDVKRLLSIVSSGELLPNLQIEWIDPFKADFSNNLIDLFLDIVHQPGLDISAQDRIHLMDTILIHDSLNEEALKFKCSILVRMGKNGLAKNAYNSFSKEYRLLFGTDFKQTFEQVISL